ncbi:uncharacterized protein APUU_51513A [Aspergillus puulaauensis]|uniref:Uncharacterized protein n=1 Tax=Aspergillus puulaauensis TaxID=1220207 RepID=A0A7R8AQ88_9EURO|nr:uncharacterized protein APUU_51513A [Aspergillus puulaauensis]BCS26802.1 hypothetical protein APUU_51513A [Aspergillus puulaauensis]
MSCEIIIVDRSPLDISVGGNRPNDPGRAGPTVVRYTTQTRNYASQGPYQGPGSPTEPEAKEQRN